MQFEDGWHAESVRQTPRSWRIKGKTKLDFVLDVTGPAAEKK
jgi:hypothetical protein